MDTKQAEGMFTNKNATGKGDSGSSRIEGGSARAEKRAIAAKPRGALVSKTKKVARRSSRMPSNAERLVCRYCGSDDLAPSFKKRRDARCRACFKKRYASTRRSKNAKHIRKAKVAK